MQLVSRDDRTIWSGHCSPDRLLPSSPLLRTDVERGCKRPMRCYVHSRYGRVLIIPFWAFIDFVRGLSAKPPTPRANMVFHCNNLRRKIASVDDVNVQILTCLVVVGHAGVSRI